MKLREIYDSVRQKVDSVEKTLISEFSNDLDILDSMARHVFEGGGKRIRPALLCLVAKACGYKGDKDIQYGAVFELVHTATLIHDDIIDNADLRRGRKVLNHEYGTTISILFGDHLYNKAMEMAIREDDFRIVRLINKATEKMVTGEILQHQRNYSADQTLDEYLDLIERKTAWIFAGCASAAAILADVDDEIEKAMFDYGIQLGMAFQVIDDYFDYASSEKELGKPVGSDLQEGKITYPIIKLLEEKPKIKEVIVEGFNNKHFEENKIAEIVTLMKKGNALEHTRDLALLYAEQAADKIDILEDSKAAKALRELPKFVVNRRK